MDRGAHSAKAVVYRLDLDNEIDFNPTLGFFGTNDNLDPTRRNGVILEGRWQLNPKLGLSGQYGWVDAQFDSGPFAGNAVPLVAEHSLRIAADYDLSHGWRLFGEAIHLSDRYAGSDYANGLPKVDAYTLLNLQVRRAWGPWQVALRIDNLTDQEYSESAFVGYNPTLFWAPDTAYYPAPERRAALEVAYRWQ